MGKKRRSRSEKRKAKARAIEKQEAALNSADGRYQWINKLGTTDLAHRMRKGKGVKRQDSKKDGTDQELIHTDRTMRNYAVGWHLFSKWLSVRINADEAKILSNINDIDSWCPHVNEYIQHLIDNGYSADTQASYKSAITKVLQVPSNTFISTEKRTRNQKVNNRTKDRDDRLSETKNKRWKRIVSATGLRKQELQKVQGTCLEYEPKKGLWQIHLHGGAKHGAKGGRERWVPIIASSEEELQEIVDLFKQAGSKKVFQVPSALKPHKYRADYAARLYRKVARDPKNISNRKEKIFLRNELKGVVLDRKACKIVTKALGHNREEEFPKSYAYKLVQT